MRESEGDLVGFNDRIAELKSEYWPSIHYLPFFKELAALEAAYVLDRVGAPDCRMVLDVGALFCDLSATMSSTSTSVAALDISSSALQVARARHAKVSGLNLVLGSATTLPFVSHSFDGVVCSHVLEHLEPISLLREMHRVMKPGARIVIVIPNGHPIRIGLQHGTSIADKMIRPLLVNHPISRYALRYDAIVNESGLKEHHAEYTAGALAVMLEETGFLVEDLRTLGFTSLFGILTYVSEPISRLASDVMARARMKLLTKALGSVIACTATPC